MSCVNSIGLHLLNGETIFGVGADKEACCINVCTNLPRKSEDLTTHSLATQQDGGNPNNASDYAFILHLNILAPH